MRLYKKKERKPICYVTRNPWGWCLAFPSPSRPWPMSMGVNTYETKEEAYKSANYYNSGEHLKCFATNNERGDL